MNPELTKYVQFIRTFLLDNKRTTREVETFMDFTFDYHCPDDFTRSLNKLRKMGLIKGEVDFEKGGWVWWINGSENIVDKENELKKEG